MRPHNPMLDTYRQLSTEVVQRVSPHFQTGYLVTDSKGPVPPKASALWKPVPKLLDQIDTALTDLGEGILRIATTDRLTPYARSEDISKLADTVRRTVDAATSDVLDRAGQILEITKEAAYPSRPQPADATQEAALAGIKGDLRMVWDPLASDDLTDGMAGSLRRALSEGDELTSWLLASSHWPEDYLASRGEAVRRDVWAEYVARELDAVAPADLGEARRAYRFIADRRHGLPVFEVLFAQLDRTIDDLANWRPNSDSMIPPTRA